jgi:hypothetical protein
MNVSSYREYQRGLHEKGNHPSSFTLFGPRRRPPCSFCSSNRSCHVVCAIHQYRSTRNWQKSLVSLERSLRHPQCEFTRSGRWQFHCSFGIALRRHACRFDWPLHFYSVRCAQDSDNNCADRSVVVLCGQNILIWVRKIGNSNHCFTVRTLAISV